MSDSKREVIRRLSQVAGDGSQKLLLVELEKIARVLQESADYTELMDSLELMQVFVHRLHSEGLQLATGFLERLPTIEVNIPAEWKNYYSKDDLTCKCIEALERIRYLELESVVHLLFRYSQVENKEVSDAARSAVSSLSKINLAVYNQVGPSPQLQLVAIIERLGLEEMKSLDRVVLDCIKNFLSANIEGTKWFHDKVTWQAGLIPDTQDVRALRQRSINILYRMYALHVNDSDWKKQVIQVFNEATRAVSGTVSNEGTTAMVAENTLEVLHFYISILSAESLEIVQKLEHDSFWLYYHASNEEIETLALEIEKLIAKQKEYQIYRDLIGFEGIFGDWHALKGDLHGVMAFNDDALEARVHARIAEVSEDNFTEWSARILYYSSISSNDLAFFRAFNIFLTELSQKFPEKMTRLLVENTDALSKLLIPILKGLLGSESRQEVTDMMKSWIQENKFCFQCVRVYQLLDFIDIEVIEQAITSASKTEDESTLSIVLSALVEHFGELDPEVFSGLFKNVIELLTSMGSTSWVEDTWFSKRLRGSVKKLNSDAVSAIFINLVLAKEIGYHEEEIISLFVHDDVDLVLQLFSDRLATEKGDEIRFNAIPYEFHRLGKLFEARHEEVLDFTINLYANKSGEFRFGAALLIPALFPILSDDLAASMIKAINTKDRSTNEAIVYILQNYNGEEVVFRVCAEIVTVLDENDELLGEVAVALDATSVLVGEYGPAEAQEKKADVAVKFLGSELTAVNSFFTKYSEQARERAARERARAAEDIELRKYQYGSDDSIEN
jgi:hypothetical protein